MLITDQILTNLILNESFSRKTLAFIRPEYFQDTADQTLFTLISDYTQKYNCAPSKEALLIDLENRNGLNQDVFESVEQKIRDAEIDEKTSLDFLVSQAEDYCKDRALYNAIVQSLDIMDKSKKGSSGISVGQIPKLLEDALGVSFDTNIGHDFLEQTLSRYDYYHNKENKIPFDIDYLNKITKGGLPRKTLSILLSSTTGGGKSLCMCHMASANLLEGYNVLYITMEMAEEKIAERIDANLMDLTIDELHSVPKDVFEKRAKKVKDKAKGKLIIKEYPTGTAHSGHFRHLLHELRLKKNFIPDVIYVDYLNICASARVKMANVSSYTLVKTIAEELRALAIESNVVMISATQGNRSAVNSSDIDLTNTSESIGLPATVDFMVAIITSEQLEELKQLLFKQLKNRYGPLDVYRRFVVGIDRDKMRLFNLSENAQESYRKSGTAGQIDEDTPMMDKTEFGQKDSERGKKSFTNWS